MERQVAKILVAGIIIILILGLVYWQNDIDKKDNDSKAEVSEDAIAFKEEYEALNNKGYKEVIINENNPVVYSNYEEIKELITSGTGVIYFGFPECPWCRTALPVLLDSAKENGLEKVYYFNALSIRDKKTLNQNGDIITEKEGTNQYYELIQLLYNYLDEYEGLNDSTIKRLYFPTIVFVKNGKILGVHVGTVETQKSSNDNLTEKQTQELKDIYTRYILQTLDIICDNEQKNC